MGRLLIGLVVSLAVLALFSVVAYDMPLAGAIVPFAGSLILLAVLVGHLWARDRREARG
jgi:hypothetical protein